MARLGPALTFTPWGATLYEMLTGRPPFRGESPADTERQVLTEEPVPARRLNAAVPRDLEIILVGAADEEAEFGVPVPLGVVRRVDLDVPRRVHLHDRVGRASRQDRVARMS